MSITPSTQALLAWPYRLLQTPLGRRTAAAMLISVTLATTVQTLYANADAPGVPVSAFERRTGAGARADAAAGAAGAAGDGAAAAGRDARLADAPDRPAGRGDRAATANEPGKVAIAWYAEKRRVPAGNVRLLQQRRIGANEVRVLVMAEIGDRIDTAEVTVRRGKAGWRVP